MSGNVSICLFKQIYADFYGLVVPFLELIMFELNVHYYDSTKVKNKIQKFEYTLTKNLSLTACGLKIL